PHLPIRSHRMPPSALRHGRASSTSARPGDAPSWSVSARPWLLGGAVALTVARLFWPSESASWRGDGLPLALGWLLPATVWAAAAVYDRRVLIRFGALDAVVALLFLWMAIAALHGARYDAPRPALNMIWEWLALGAGYFLFRQLLADSAESRAVVVVMLTMAMT